MLVRHRITNDLVTCSPDDLPSYPEVEWEYNPSQETLDAIEAARATAAADRDAAIAADRAAIEIKETRIAALLEIFSDEIDTYLGI